MKNKDAIVLFLKKEGQELLGKRKANFWVLTAIFLLAILSIGFEGSFPVSIKTLLGCSAILVFVTYGTIKLCYPINQYQIV